MMLRRSGIEVSCSADMTDWVEQFGVEPLVEGALPHPAEFLSGGSADNEQFVSVQARANGNSTAIMMACGTLCLGDNNTEKRPFPGASETQQGLGYTCRGCRCR
jgi:hypothetical protein